VNTDYQAKPPILLVVCNALDDYTRQQRRIETDSPAASRKVFEMCKALRKAGVHPFVLSLGRGRADGSDDSFSSHVCRVNGIPVIYASFSHRRVWSELQSIFGLLNPLRRLAHYPQKAVIFYNRIPAYLLLLRESSRLGYRNFLDLEDGEVDNRKTFKRTLSRLMAAQFDRHCQDGALLACTALTRLTNIRPVFYYYGTAVGDISLVRWQSSNITCLMSGTLTADTGAPLLIEAIRRLRGRQLRWADALTFEITGKGESLVEFEQLAAEPGLPKVIIHGRTTDSRYKEILRSCEIGLALKPVGGPLADTTFPSKVIEFAASELLVLSTDISDVRHLLGDDAYYLERNDPEQLIERLKEITKDRKISAHRAHQGRLAIEKRCSPERAGNELRSFLFRSIA